MLDVPYAPHGSLGDWRCHDDHPRGFPFAMIWHNPDLDRAQTLQVIEMLNDYADALRWGLVAEIAKEQSGEPQ